MSTTKQNLTPCKTCIFSYDDGAHGTGIITGPVTNRDDQTEVLVLGWFQAHEQSPNANVFSDSPNHRFPSYFNAMSQNVLPYNFEPERTYLREHDTEWWRSIGGCTNSNLITTHFGPKNEQALLYIDMTHHLLGGGTIDDYSCWRYFDDRVFLELWAELASVLDTLVPQPPAEWNSSRNNIWYEIGPGDRAKYEVSWGLR